MISLSNLIDSSGKEYKASIFWPQAQAAYAKAIIFIAEARIAIKSYEYIWAAIALYYSLFHLTISLMFMVPKLIKQEKLSRLLTSRHEGTSDPTYLITHSELPEFLKRCESKGFTDKLRKYLTVSKELREFVNYKPRIEFQGERLIFRSRQFQRQDVEQTIEAIERLLTETLLWAGQQNETSKLVSKVSVFSLEQFLNQKDLLYKEWCPPKVLNEAKKIMNNLPIKITYRNLHP